VKEWLNQNYTAQRRENIEIVDLKGNKIMICPTCGGDTFIEIDDGLKCENCGYVYNM